MLWPQPPLIDSQGSSVGVLDSQLCLAHSTQTTESGSLAPLQQCRELGQQVFASGEEGVARVGDGPDRRVGVGRAVQWFCPLLLDGTLAQVGNGTANAGDDIGEGFILVRPLADWSAGPRAVRREPLASRRQSS